MQRRQLIKGLAAGAIVSTLLPAFAAEPVTLKVGASPLVTGDILEFVKPALAKKGINLKIIEFTDYIQPNLALADKEIDANLFQHKPFMDKFWRMNWQALSICRQTSFGGISTKTNGSLPT